MISLSTDTNTQYVQVIPRYYDNLLTLVIHDEYTDTDTEIQINNPIYCNGYLDFSFEFAPVEKRNYKITLIDSINNTLWKGKARGQ